MFLKGTGAEERLETRHPGGLQGRRISQMRRSAAVETGPTKPDKPEGEDLEEAKEAIAWLLRRGMSSLLDDVQELLQDLC